MFPTRKGPTGPGGHHRPTSHLGQAIALSFALAVQPVAAQSARTDSLFHAGSAEGSYGAALAQVARTPNDFEALWRASRAETARGILSGGTDPEKAQIYKAAEEFARRAIAREPHRPEGYYWLAAALGRRTWVEPPFVAARLAAETRRETLRVLAIDSLHAGAHALLGRLYSEAANLPWSARLLAAPFIGIPPGRAACRQLAERELTRAIALDSGAVLFRADLATLYLRMHREGDAERTVRALVALPPRSPVDTQFQRESRVALEHYRARR